MKTTPIDGVEETPVQSHVDKATASTKASSTKTAPKKSASNRPKQPKTVKSQGDLLVEPTDTSVGDTPKPAKPKVPRRTPPVKATLTNKDTSVSKAVLRQDPEQVTEQTTEQATKNEAENTSPKAKAAQQARSTTKAQAKPLNKPLPKASIDKVKDSRPAKSSLQDAEALSETNQNTASKKPSSKRPQAQPKSFKGIPGHLAPVKDGLNESGNVQDGLEASVKEASFQKMPKQANKPSTDIEFKAQGANDLAQDENTTGPHEGASEAMNEVTNETEGEAATVAPRSRRRRGGRRRSTKTTTPAADTASVELAPTELASAELATTDANSSQESIESTSQKTGRSTKKSKRLDPVQDTTPEELESKAPKQMLISVLPNEQAEVVIVEEGRVVEYYIEMAHHVKIRGNIYKGVISNIDANLQAAFVNYGQNKNGFLQIDEVHQEYYLQHHELTKGQKYPPIQKVLKAGQEVMVQVVKEPSGTKGAFLTTWVSLAGRFLVLTPGQEQIGISRKVVDEGERSRLRELIRGIEPGPGLGAIVRTVSAGTSKTTLQKDLNFLKRLWKDVLKNVTTEKAPALLYQEPNLATRAIRDYLSERVDAVWVDDASTMESIKTMVQLLFPRKTKLVHLYKSTSPSLFNHFKVQKQLDQVYSREVVMPAGGRLVFDQTEALMAIDINSGKTSGKSNFESMALRTNTEAAVAIAQQLRLRDIGGQVVIDFIEMRDQAQCRSVEKILRNAMKFDRARHDIGKMSDFGLLQLVRQRIGSSAISISQEPCPCCNGTGMRRNMEWQALHTLRDITNQARDASKKSLSEISCTVELEVGLYLLNQKRQRLLDIEAETGVRIQVTLNNQ